MKGTPLLLALALPVSFFASGLAQVAPPAAARPHTVPRSDQFEMRSQAGIVVRYRLLVGENHGSAPLPAIGSAIPIVFGDNP